MKILLHDNSLNERGSTGAMLDYANHLKELGHEITIGFNKTLDENMPEVVKTVSMNYETIGYSNFDSVKTLPVSAFDFMYFIKEGKNDGLLHPHIPSGIHSVFQYFEPHGTSYNYVSEWLFQTIMRKRSSLIAKNFVSGNFRNLSPKPNWVPHMVDLPKSDRNVREELKIPLEASLGLRIGGKNSFDLKIAQDAISEVLSRDSNFWFVFVNTQKFIEHKQVIYLPAIFHKQEKVNLLESADFFIHGRSNGESFGLSILEAMALRKAIFAWSGGLDRNHLEFLPNEALYGSTEGLVSKILNHRNFSSIEDYSDIVDKFRPNKVMQLFLERFDLL